MVLICWGVIYEREQGMLRIEYRYKCPTVVRGRQSSPTTLDLESNSPQRCLAPCSSHSYQPKLDLWQGTWPDHLLWGWLMVIWVRLPNYVECCCHCSCNLGIKQVDSHESTWWLREQQQPKSNKHPAISSLWIWNQKRSGTTQVRRKRVNISEFMATIIMVDSGTRPSVVGQWANTYCIGVTYSDNLLEGLVRPLHQCWNIVFNQPAVATDWVTEP